MTLPTLLYSIPGASLASIRTPPRVRQLAAMRDAGVHGFEVAYNLSDGWRASGRLDPQVLDESIRHVLRLDPRARILIRVDMRAPGFWLERRPEDVVGYGDGPPNVPREVAGGGYDLDLAQRPWRVSLASGAWRRASSDALAAVVRHIERAAYRDRVVGIMTANCTFGEWHYWGFWFLPDTGPAMTAHFQRWARRLYRGRLGDLRAAWGRTIRRWEDVRPPGAERVQKARSSFRAGPHAAWARDYVRCHQELVADTIIAFGRTVKAASRGRLLTGAFYGYLFGTPWSDEGGHLEFGRLLRSPHVDYFAAPQLYDIRARRMGGTGLDRSLVASVVARGKMYFAEADTPTHRGRRMAYFWKTRKEIALNPGDSIALVRRDAARALTEGHRLWWFDFGRKFTGGEYLHGRIMADIARLVGLAGRVEKMENGRASQVAVAYDGPSFYAMSHWRAETDGVSPQVTDRLIHEAQHLGAPADAVLWEDVNERHRLVVMANAFSLDERRRELLRKRVCAGGRSVLWMYGPGAVQPDRPGVVSAVRISDLTGIRVRAMAPARPAVRFAEDSPLLAGLRGREYRYEPAGVWMERFTDLPAPRRIVPAFFVDDPEATPLAFWSGTRRVAMAAKMQPWGLSIHSALPLLPARFLRNLLVGAGGHVYCRGEGIWMASQGVLAVHTLTGGRRRVALPGPAEVVDGFTGRAVVRGAAMFDVVLPKRSTTIWVVRRG